MRLLLTVFTSFIIGYSYSQSSISGSSLPTIDKEFQTVIYVIDKDGLDITQKVDTLTWALDSIKEIFAPIGLSFQVNSSRQITNPAYENLTVELRDEMLAKYHKKNRINIYVVESSANNSESQCGMTTLGGITEGGSENIKPIVVLTDTNLTNVRELSRQIAHYFGVRNTFATDLGQELVNGSNCSTAGDLVCDTPADPYKEGVCQIDSLEGSTYIDPNCIFNSTLQDSNKQYYTPYVDNIMSNYAGCECGTFTRGQFTLMVETYKSNPTHW